MFILRTHISYTTNTWWNNTWQSYLGIAFFIYDDIWPIRTILHPKYPWKYRGHFDSLQELNVVFTVLICQIATHALRVCVCASVSKSEVRAQINHGRWLIQLDLLTYCEQLWPCLFSSLTFSHSLWNAWGSWNMCAPNTHICHRSPAHPPLNLKTTKG